MSTDLTSLVDPAIAVASAAGCVLVVVHTWAIWQLVKAGAFPERWWQRVLLGVHAVVFGALWYKAGWLVLFLQYTMAFRLPARAMYGEVVLWAFVLSSLLNLPLFASAASLVASKLLWRTYAASANQGGAPDLSPPSPSVVPDAPQVTARTGWKRAANLVAGMLLPGVVLALMVLGMGTLWFGHCSAVCPRCLQHAYVCEWKVFGVVVSRAVKPFQHSGGLMSPSAFSPAVPQVSPELFSEIVGQPCAHIFRMGGCGLYHPTDGHSDFSLGGWESCEPRIRATEAAYGAFRSVPDRSLARATLALIDEAYPIETSGFAPGPGAVCFFGGEVRLPPGDAGDDMPELSPLAVALNEELPCLAGITTDQEWQGIIQTIQLVGRAPAKPAPPPRR